MWPCCFQSGTLSFGLRAFPYLQPTMLVPLPRGDDSSITIETLIKDTRLLRLLLFHTYIFFLGRDTGIPKEAPFDVVAYVFFFCEQKTS